MANELLRSRHAFGALERVLDAISSGKVDAYDILFVKDKNGKPYIGWVEKDGTPVIVKEDEKVILVDKLPDVGETGKLYIFNEDGYFWNGENFISLSKSIDLTALEDELAKLKAENEQMMSKLDVINSDLANMKSDMNAVEHLYEKIEYEISHKPEGTLVDHRDKEIRVMCPVGTEWVKQNVGTNGDADKYYMGFKAYAPEGAVSFKEDTKDFIEDQTMHYFENNDFAGVDEYGRKYSIVWLALAYYDKETDKWTYYGEKSSTEKYIGWYYSVEWYDANGVMIDADCIRINLSNEACHTTAKPYYIADFTSVANEYTDQQIAMVLDSITFIEF